MILLKLTDPVNGTRFLLNMAAMSVILARPPDGSTNIWLIGEEEAFECTESLGEIENALRLICTYEEPVELLIVDVAAWQSKNDRREAKRSEYDHREAIRLGQPLPKSEIEE